MKTLCVVILFFSFNLVKGQGNELYLNYLTAVYNESTFQYFVVIKYKNLNTSEIKEACIQGEDLRHAIREELKLNYEGEDYTKLQEILKSNTERYFEFKNDKALSIIEVEKNSLEKLKLLERKVNFDKLAKKIKRTKSCDSININTSLALYAHALFNRGILTGENNCMGGKLYYVDRNNQF